MSAGDIVSPRIRVNQNPQTLINQPPVFGIIAEQPVLPGTISVLWDNMNTAALTVVALADANLDLILTPTPSVVTSLLGRWVRRITGTVNLDLDPSGGTSREYDGKVVALYQRRPLEDAGATPVDFALVQLDDATFIEDVAARFVAAAFR